MLSETIYRLRRKRGLSQEQLAEQLGVSRQAVSKWESGQSVPELDKLQALSRCFGVTLDQLMGEGEELSPLQKNAEQEVPLNTEKKVGVVLCLLGAVCLLFSGVLLLVDPEAYARLNASSAVTLNGSAILQFYAAAVMLLGLALVLRRRK